MLHQLKNSRVALVVAILLLSATPIMADEVRGRITAIDAEGQVLAIESRIGQELVFVAVPNCPVFVNNVQGNFFHLQVDDQVIINYEGQGMLRPRIATSISSFRR